MTDRKISNLEFASLNYFLTRAFIVGFTFNSILIAIKNDSWLIPILSIFPSFIIIFIVNYIMNYKPKLDFPEKVFDLFNKKIAILILFIIFLLLLFMSLLNYISLNNFVMSQFLNKTPLLVVSILFMLSTFYILKKGLNTITRTSNLLFYIGFLLAILSFIGLIPAIKINNLKPFFNNNLSNYSTALGNFYSFNIIHMYLLTIIPKNKFSNPKIKKTLIISYLISSISVFLLIFQTIATFGYELSSLYEYPEFFALKHVALSILATRVESVLAIQLILDIFIFNLFSIFFMGNTLKKIFNTNKNIVIFLILCIVMVIMTNTISKYNIFIDNLSTGIVPIIYGAVITSILIIICVKIKMSN